MGSGASLLGLISFQGFEWPKELQKTWQSTRTRKAGATGKDMEPYVRLLNVYFVNLCDWCSASYLVPRFQSCSPPLIYEDVATRLDGRCGSMMSAVTVNTALIF